MFWCTISLYIFTRSLYLVKYCRTRKNIQRYCTPKHPIRYIYTVLLLEKIFNDNHVSARALCLIKHILLVFQFSKKIEYRWTAGSLEWLSPKTSWDGRYCFQLFPTEKSSVSVEGLILGEMGGHAPPPFLVGRRTISWIYLFLDFKIPIFHRVSCLVPSSCNELPQLHMFPSQNYSEICRRYFRRLSHVATERLPCQRSRHLLSISFAQQCSQNSKQLRRVPRVLQNVFVRREFVSATNVFRAARFCVATEQLPQSP